MALEKDNIYEFGFGRTDNVSKNVNLLDEAVFSFIYGGLFKVLKSLELSSILDLEIVFRLYINFFKGLSFYDIQYFTQSPERTLWRRLKYLEEKNVIKKLKNQKDKRTNRFVLSRDSYKTLSNSIPKEDLAITISKISMSYADKLWMFNVRDPNKVKKTLLNLARSAVSLNENNYLCQFSFALAYYYGSNFDLALNHSYNSIKLDKKFAHGRRLFGSALFQIDEKKRAYSEMEKALDLYDDIYGQWRTYFELWRFNFLDENLKESQKYSKKLIQLKSDYPQSYIAYLATFNRKDSLTKTYKKKLEELVPNIAPGMIKNFHAWLTPNQAKKIENSLKVHFL
ncbi:MAG: hypothetical protein CMD43_01265 [Gammaproteobacteria bacterium]|nr:hypothetical protein [Gammaproteobacteria bacterium]